MPIQKNILADSHSYLAKYMQVNNLIPRVNTSLVTNLVWQGRKIPEENESKTINVNFEYLTSDGQSFTYMLY